MNLKVGAVRWTNSFTLINWWAWHTAYHVMQTVQWHLLLDLRLLNVTQNLALSS